MAEAITDPHERMRLEREGEIKKVFDSQARANADQFSLVRVSGRRWRVAKRTTTAQVLTTKGADRRLVLLHDVNEHAFVTEPRSWDDAVYELAKLRGVAT